MFRLLSEVRYYSRLVDRIIKVPEGYETDFASIPQFLKDRIDVNGKHREAAILHDYLCTDGHAVYVSQKQADQIFLEAMKVLGVPIIRRRLMYWGVCAYQRWVNFGSYSTVKVEK